jgi:putative PD-(D/E)XK family protein DUF4420
MVALDLVELFGSLVMPMPAVTGSDLAAIPIPGADTHRLAKDASGSPCLLIRQPPRTARSAPIRLENLLVSFEVPCAITAPGGKLERDTFTIVRCSPANPRLFSHFLKIISPLVAGLGQSPTTAAVRRVISGLVELFQALAAPARKTIQGLWAELLLIRLSSDPRAMVAAWHLDPLEHFDFAAGPQRIEVKSSNSRRREHHFSLEQLTSFGVSRIVVASVFVERVGGGVSLRKVIDDTRALLEGEVSLTTQLDACVYESLGSAWADAMEECFDWDLAVDSIAFYPAENVPRPENSTPQSVSDVRFRSDLGSTPQLDRQRLQELGGIFAATVPR